MNRKEIYKNNHNTNKLIKNNKHRYINITNEKPIKSKIEKPQ